MRFQDAVKDARAVVYAGIQADPLVARAARLLADATQAQRVLARAVMNGETTDAEAWRVMFPTLFSGTPDAAELASSEAILDAALEIAERGEQVRSQFRGALVEELTAVLLARRVAADAIRRERRVLFDGVRAEVHPYDVTVERSGAAEVYDCKWGARGINADVLHQLDDARIHALRRTRRSPSRSWSLTRSDRAGCASPSRRRRPRARHSSRSRRSTGCRSVGEPRPELRAAAIRGHAAARRRHPRGRPRAPCLDRHPRRRPGDPPAR